MRRISIANKLMLSMGIISTVVALLSSGAITALVYIETERQIKQEMVSIASTLITNEISVSDGVITTTANDGGRSLTESLRDNDVSLAIVNRDRQIIARYGIYRNLEEAELAQFWQYEQKENISNMKGSYKDISTPGHGRYDTYTAPLIYNDNLVGFIQIARANKVLPILFTSLINALSILIPIVWLVTLIASRWAASQVISPLTTFISYIENLDMTKLKNKISMPDKIATEIETMVNTFNTLLARVAGTIERERGVIRSISHELKTPLTRVVGLLQTTNPTKSEVGMAEKELVQMGRTIDTILDTSIGNTQTSDDKWQLRTLVTEVRDSMSSLREIIIHISPTMTLPVSRESMRIVLRNLLENALKYSPSRTSIIVTGRRSNTGWTIGVTNSVSKIISKRGYGIGLHLIETICRNQGWKVEIKQTRSNYTTTVSGETD